MELSGRRSRWHEGLTSTHWIILAVASAGWVFDVYEGQLFTIFKTPMLAELTGGSRAAIDRQANLGFAAFLLGGAVGGLGFGLLGDRHGRLRVLSATILVYSLFSALTAYARATWHVHALRFLVALGTGGEWAVAAALVAETFPARTRASASGIFLASSVLGVGLASLTGLIFVRPDSWRVAFLIGLMPALLVLWIRLGLQEPPKSAPSDCNHAAGAVESGGLAELFGPGPWRTRAILGLGLATVGLATYWGIFAWGPELAARALDESASAERKQAASSLAYLLMNFSGGLLGLLSFAPLANRLGRRGAFALYHAGAGLLVPCTFLTGYGYAPTLCLLSLMAFFVLGMHAGYAIYFPELFPTRLRATGAIVCFNLGRVLGAVILLIRGELGARLGMAAAASAISCLFWLGLVILSFTPETRGRELP
jgi:predicted MFS family arabinose efflux permease